MLHRPGPELKRLTPRNNDKLLFDGIPWVSRAQDEHDAFAEALRDRGVEVLYLTDLLTETLQSPRRAREHAIAGAMANLHLGDTLRDLPRRRRCTTRRPRSCRVPHRRCPQRRGPRRPRPGHQPAGPRRLPHRPAAQPAVHPRLQRLDPRPGGDHLAGDAGPRARDPADRADLHRAPALRRHRRSIHGWQREHVEGGDVLLLAPGVIAVGVGERTTPAGAERLARQVFGAGPRAHRARRAHRAGARHHAPRHRLHDGRRRQDRDVPQRRRQPARRTP